MCPERWCWVTPLRISEIDPTLIDPIDSGRSESDRSDPDRSDPDRPDPDRSDPDRSSPDRSDPDRFDTDRSHPDRSDPIDPTLIDSTLIDPTPIYPNAYLRKLWRNGDAWMRVWERLELLWKWSEPSRILSTTLFCGNIYKHLNIVCLFNIMVNRGCCCFN